MGRTRPSGGGQDSRDNEVELEAPVATAPPSVGVELLGYGPGGADLNLGDAAVPDAQSKSTQVAALGSVAGLLGLALLALLLLGSSSSSPGEGDDAQVALPQVQETPSVPPETSPGESEVDEPTEAALAAAERAQQLEYLGALGTVRDGLLDDMVVAWIGADDQLQLRSLETGSGLPVSALAKHDLPPLPVHIQLLGAENATWLVDLVDPVNSGKLSNEVRMVRFGAGLDSYGFISENSDGPTDFFVGSLWGPSMNGTAQTPKDWTILPVAGKGIVVSSPTAESSSIQGSGIEPLPRRVGRVVAANHDHVAGVSCDNRLQCVGAVSRWDGSDQQQVDANALTNDAIVRISPDGGHLLSIKGDRWTVFDLDDDSYTMWDGRLGVDDTITWSPDSAALLWIVEETLVAIDVSQSDIDGFPARLVSPVGALGPRLSGSDVVVYDVTTVSELANGVAAEESTETAG